MYVVGRYALLFVFYSFLGAIAETLFRLVTEHQLYGIHGFLHLPILPIYGVGALVIVKFIGKSTSHPLVLFVNATFVTTVIEFVAHWLIEVIFHVRIWDYSAHMFNLFGRVSLMSSIAFGLVAMLLVYIIHPWALKMLKHVSKRTVTFWGWVIATILLADIVISAIQRLG